MKLSSANQQIIFVDSAVQNYQYLIQVADAATKTVILDNKSSGIAQITAALTTESNIAAIHIISHGSPGNIELGTESLNCNNLEKFSTQLQQWRKSLTTKANILLYGCEVAKEETGKNFLKRLNEIAGADIAASANLTGSRELGGDWELEVRTGPIETAIPFSLNTLKTYSGVLSLDTKVDFTTGGYPSFVSIGDFNGDGKPDLAVTSAGDDTVSILLNTTATGATTPTFAIKVDFTTGDGPYSISIGDINGDGKPDLAVGNRFTDNASILLNTTPTGVTTPTFAPQVTLATGADPNSISIGDFNGDGKPDLAVASAGDDNASILLNTTTTGATTPSFATKVDFTTGDNPIS
ncbi:MAG: DUF4347 domain-containing protein, partial [Microcoleus sp.]